MYERVLVGTDGSVTSERAVTKAVSLASSLGASLVVVAAVRPISVTWPVASTGGAALEVFEGTRHRVAAAALDRAEAVARAAGLDVVARLEDGEPVDVLVRCAEESVADVIVVGSVGLNSAGHYVTGSVPEGLALRAKRHDVLVVRTC